MKNAPLAAALLVTLTVATTANAQRQFYASGDGNVKCGDYLQARERQQKVDGIVSWTWGYITAYNQWSTAPSVDSPPDRNTIIAYLDKHCRDNPLDVILQGVGKLLADLGGGVRTASPAGKR